MSYNHEQNQPDPATPFRYQFDITPVPPTASGSLEVASIKGVVTAITVEDEAASINTYPAALTIESLRGQADFHSQLFEAMDMPLRPILPVMWRGQELAAIAHWSEIPRGSEDWQVANGGRGVSGRRIPPDTSRDRLEITVSTEPVTRGGSDLTEPLARTIAEILTAGLVRHMGPDLAERQLKIELETTHRAHTRAAVFQTLLGNLGIESEHSRLDHERFAAFLS